MKPLDKDEVAAESRRIQLSKKKHEKLERQYWRTINDDDNWPDVQGSGWLVLLVIAILAAAWVGAAWALFAWLGAK